MTERMRKMTTYPGYPKPCGTCYWKKWPYARPGEVCGFHNKPQGDGTCRYFESEWADGAADGPGQGTT